ncbi:MAG: PAS domain S-box protein [Acidobacteria bacterium]|nr:PAS domain S-box protein [Acidobacteriota bacterium]NIM63231.1 PAS domain S-box protein [Acidobacteriota bacterium]NIO61009.1 PAS domain S-box protein [Acidobacteriota bacterium]NIQ87518.1 PAS domain S-box protein [Acidobacteriota bacterium]NIT12646.1 PAS domain S-box protein [Acidobacteriota bacterium]
MCFRLSAEGTVLSVNRYGAEHLGYERNELVGQSLLRVVHEEDRPSVSRRLAECVVVPDTTTAWEFRKVRKDGSVLWVRERARAMTKPNGEAVLLVVCDDVTERKEVEQHLLEQRAQLRDLRLELSLAEQRERRRIGAGLHDSVGQDLAFARMKLRELEAETLASETRRCVEAIGQHLDEAIRATRTLTFELTSPILYELGLEAAIRNLVDRMGAQDTIRFTVRSSGSDETLPEDLNVILYRACAELLLNVRKHARCSEVEVAIECTEEGIRISVQDDGAGFDAGGAGKGSDRTGGYGLFSIREELQPLGGRFEVDSEPGRGTRAVIVAPRERTAIADAR